MKYFSTILIISPESWNGHSVSKHHYAATLAERGHRVYFLDPPDETLCDLEITPTRYENLYRIRGPKVAPGLRLYPPPIRRRMERRWLRKLESTIGRRIDIVWLFENSRFYDLSFAGERLKIYHQVDLNQDFHLAEAARSADICFATSDHILQRIRPYNRRAFKIHHGVALYKRKQDLSALHKERFDGGDIHATLVGNMEIAYLDIELLLKLVSKHRKVIFHLVGGYNPDGRVYRALSGSENIRWWGRVESPLIPSILEASDILLLTYRALSPQDSAQLANPHKLMEYLASGKTIVATYTDEYRDKPHLLEMVGSHEEFLERFGDIVTNIDRYNSLEKQRVRRTFAEDHSYDRQLQRIEEYLKRYNLSL